MGQTSEAQTPKPRLPAAAAARLLPLAALGALVLFCAIVWASWRKTPDWTGVLSGVFVGLFVALLALLGALWGLVALITPPKPVPPLDMRQAGELQALLAPVLTELEAVRADFQARIRARSVTRIPLCVAGAIGLWIVFQTNRDPPGVFELVGFCVVGAGAGSLWASQRLAAEYARLYKARVLPSLAARFGELSYRPSPGVDLADLTRHGLFGKFDAVSCEDEIYGTYSGHPVRVTELKLEEGSGKNRRTVFDGLVVAVDLPRRLQAVTAVVVEEADTLQRLRGLILPGNVAATGLRPVGLEDPAFSARYRVYGDDQVEARALLTPTFMERMMALSARTGFAPPVALAEGARLTVALPKSEQRNLFEPPPYSQPAAGARALLALSGDITASLRMVDAVIALDD